MGLERISIDRKIVGGKPVIKGTRIPVHLILELLASGMNETEVLKEYPELNGDDVKAALKYAARLVSQEAVIPMKA